MSKRKRDLSTAALAASLLTHRSAIGEAGQRLFAPVLREGQELPDLGLVAELCARRIEAAALPAAVESSLTEAREEAARELRAALTELHGLVAPTLFGKSWAERLKLPEVLPDDVEALELVARDTAKALKKKKHAKPGVKGMLPIDRSDWLDRLKKPLKTLAAKRRKKKSRRAPAEQAALACALLDLGSAEPKVKPPKVKAPKSKKRPAGEAEESNPAA